MNSTCTAAYWKHYNALPEAVRRDADKAFELWKANPNHPSLDFKKPKGRNPNMRQIRANRSYRAFCIVEDGLHIWYWIGSKQEAKRLI